MRRKVIFGFVAVCLLAGAASWGWAQDRLTGEDRALARSLRDIGLSSGKAYQMLARLTALGPRLAGSPEAAAAVELARQIMVDLGFENVHLEPVTVQRWVRGRVEEARAVSAAGTVPLTVCALGNSVPTPPQGILAPVVRVHDFGELQELGARVKGKVVFFDHPMDPRHLDTFRAYGEAAKYRVRGAVEAARLGAVAVLVRSLTLRLDDVPHTGMMIYDEHVAKIPAAAVSTKGAEQLSRVLRLDPDARIYLRLDCHSADSVASANVVGEIRGAEHPEEIVLLGGHLDSWDLGVGAHDDGAGCVQAIEALRLLKEAGVRPRRTIRAVLFMNEEFGSSGGKDYAKSPRRKGEKHLAAIESDRGGFLPLGFRAGADSTRLAAMIDWLPALREAAGILWLRRGGGGADIAALRRQGTLLLGLVPDSQRYFDVHHSANDVLSAVNPRELELGAIALSMMAYLLSEKL